MRKENKFPFLRFACVGLVLLGLAGCNAVVVKKDEGGKVEKNVQISTPFGDLKVRKDVDLSELGLTPYPSARLMPEEKGSDDSHANVNISTPFFSLKVNAAKYESDDKPEKILDFYKKDMARYGKVISCKGAGAGSNKGHDEENEFALKLNCEDVDSDSKSTTLKAGEGSSQHIVVVLPKDKATEIDLVHIRLHGGKTETM